MKRLLIALALCVMACGASDTMSIRNFSGSTITNYPVQVGRWFKQAEFASGSYPQAVIGGSGVTTQVNVQTRWGDGSVKHATISFLLASLANNATATVSFQSQASCNCGAGSRLTKAQMLAAGYDFDAAINTTLGNTTARVMLNADKYTYWNDGSVATTVIIADHSSARTYDFGSDANKSLRPIFHATFWPTINKVFVRAILEDSNTLALQQQTYNVTVTLGSATPATLYSKTGHTQYLGTRWSRVGWIGGAPPDAVNIDHNLAYLAEAKAVPNFDTTKTPSGSQLSTQYTAFQGADNGIGGQGVWAYKSAATGGGRAELNPFPLWDTLWLYTGDYRMRLMTLRTADLAASWPMYWREGDTSRTNTFGKPIGTVDRPTFRIYGDYGDVGYLNFNTDPADRVTPLEEVNTTGGWGPSGTHLYQPHYIPYLLTGDFYYLEDAWFWTSWMLFQGIPGAGGCTYCRGPVPSAAINDAEVRGDGWIQLRRSEFWALIPDSWPEKTTYHRYVIDTLALWEGKFRITGTSLDGDFIKTWQEGINFWNGIGGTPSPLHVWQWNTGLKENMDTSVAGGGTSPWMHGYLVYGLGRAVELGITEASGCLAWAGKYLVDMATQTGTLNPKAVGQYRVPTITAAGAWMTTWAQVAAGYGTYDLDTFWATGDGGLTQPLNGYPYVAQAALSMTTGLTNGSTAWTWISGQTQNQALQNDYPTWAMLPREAPAPVAPTITTTSLASGTVGVAYSQTLTASGDTPITWSVVSGSLPSWAALTEATGAITGTPDAVATTSFTVRATNATGTNDKDLSIAAVAAAGAPIVGAISAMSTGVVIYATGPTAGCTVEISEASDFATLVPSVDDAKGGQSACAGGSRPASGTSMQIVIGGPGIVTAADGKKYSKPLKPGTLHYYRLKSSGEIVASGTFITANHPFGNLRTDPPEVDPNRPGDYAYPTIDQSVANWKTTDPSTGLQYTKLTKVGDTLSKTVTAAAFTSATGSGWTDPTNILADDSSSATISGSSAILALGGSFDLGNQSWDSRSLDYLRVVLKASGAATAEADRTVQCALSLDGMTPCTPWKDVVLTNSLATYTIGSNTPGDLWQSPGSRPIAQWEVVPRSGGVDTSGTTVTLKWGDAFNIRWGSGSKITINSVEYTIASVDHDQQITLTTSAGTQPSVSYSANNFRVLVRKKTTSADTITLQYAALTALSSTQPSWPSFGMKMCSPVITTDSDGKEGTNCFIGSNLFFSPVDGSGLRSLGFVIADSAGGEMGGNDDGYSMTAFDPIDPNKFWGFAPNWYTPRRYLIRKGIYKGDHKTSAGGRIPSCADTSNIEPCMEWHNLTPESSGQDALTLIRAYGGPPATWPAWEACWQMTGGVQKSSSNTAVLGLMCGSPTDSVQKAVWLIDVGNEVPLGTEGSTVRVIAYSDSFSRPARRWGRVHGWFLPVDPVDNGWDTLSFNAGLYASSTAGQGPYTLTATSVDGVAGANFTTDLTACPANTLHPELEGQLKCTTFVANRPAPCDDDPGTEETAMIAANPTLHSTKCGGSGKYYLQDAAPGDYGMWPDETYEVAEVLKVDGTTYTLHRGDFYGQYATAGYGVKTFGAQNHTTKTVAMAPNLFDATKANQSETHHWNWVGDAYHTSTPSDTSHNLRPDFENGHTGTGGNTLVVANDFISEAYSYYNQNYQARVGSITHRSLGPGADVTMTLSPYPGGSPMLGYPMVVESHNTVFPDGKFILDGRPFNGIEGLPSQTGTLVSGQLYKFTAAAFSGSVQTPLRRKLFDTIAFAGVNPLKDISSSTTGDVIGDGPEFAYTYCVVLNANECRTGSAVGDVYVNAPQIRVPGCMFPGNAIAPYEARDICIFANIPFAHRYTQTLVRNDYEGRYARSLGSGLQLYNRYDVFMNMSFTPDGRFGLFHTVAAGWTRGDAFSVELPPLDTDSVNRTEFVPVSVKIPATAGVDNAIVQFGYSKWAPPGSDVNTDPEKFLNCTSRNEACVMAAGTSASNPYFFSSETYSGVSCASGCTINVPAVPGRTLYYRIVKRSGSTIVSTGKIQAVPVN